jgi:thioredoxin reductase
MLLTARGAEQHSNGTDTAQAFLNLALALGLPGRPYSGYGTITGQGNGQGGREHGQKADQLPGYRKLADPADRAHVAAVWGIDPDELPRPELSAYEMLDRYETNHITLHAGVRVTRIDRHAQVVLSDDGQVTPYDDLIIATGSHSFLSPMGGMYVPSTSGSDGRLLPGVFPFRTNDDTRGMIAHATHDDHRRALVIGRGLLGLEAARGLQSHGLEVTVVHSPGHLMNAQLGPEGGAILRRSMEALGIRIVTGTRTTAVWGPDRVRGVRLKDGTELECDLIVVAAGIRPNTEVAVTSGLAVERAIVVDDQMRVADEDPVFINDRVNANIQKDGTFSVVPQMRGGVTTPEQLRRMRDWRPGRRAGQPGVPAVVPQLPDRGRGVRGLHRLLRHLVRCHLVRLPAPRPALPCRDLSRGGLCPVTPPHPAGSPRSPRGPRAAPSRRCGRSRPGDGRPRNARPAGPEIGRRRSGGRSPGTGSAGCRAAG